MAGSGQDQELPAWLVHLTVVEEQTTGLTDWLVKVMLSGIDSPGYVNAEILPPAVHENQNEWTLLLRFQTMEQIGDWQNSESLKQLITEIAPMVESGNLKLTQKCIENYLAPTNVASAIVTHIKPGKEAEYRKWVGAINVAQTHAPGYRGTFLQPSPPGSKAPWTTLLRFDSPESLDRWFASAERRKLIEQAGDLLRYDLVQMTSAFPGWFPTDVSTGKTSPPWKTAMLVLMVLYPQLVLRMVLPPMFASLPPALALFLSLTLSVCLISIVLMPLSVKVFKFWLLPSGHNPKAEETKGTVILLLIFLLEIAVGFALLGSHNTKAS
jgi:antibiotic biosynthesis monooxygenase (ABM) superfamily enzyme